VAKARHNQPSMANAGYLTPRFQPARFGGGPLIRGNPTAVKLFASKLTPCLLALRRTDLAALRNELLRLSRAHGWTSIGDAIRHSL